MKMFCFLTVFKFNFFFAFSFKNGLRLPESKSIRTVDFFVSFKLKKLVLAICKMLLQMLTSATVNSV